MGSRSRLVGAAFAVALATSVAVPAAGARPAATPRTLLKTKTPIRAFAQDSGRIAWVDRNWRVEARRLRPKAKTLLVGSARPIVDSEGVPPRLVVAGARVAWTRTGGGNEFETSVWVRQAGGKAAARIVFDTSADRDERTGSYFGALAAGSSTLAFSTVDYECVDPADCSQLVAQPSGVGGVFRIVGTSHSAQVPDAPGSLELAVSAGRIALLSAPERILPAQIDDVASPHLAQPGTTVEIRNATTGALVTQFTPPGTVQALALAGPVAAVVDELPDGSRNIERYDANTGALLGTTVGVAAGDTLSANGHTFVFCVGGGKIESMDAATGAQQVLAISQNPIGLSLSGTRVAWAVNAHGRGRVLALTLH
jgi:hypothetical protein